MGNASADDAVDLMRELPAWIQPKDGEDSEQNVRHPPLPVAVVPLGPPTCWVADSPDTSNRNVAVELHWQLGPPEADEARERVLVDLLEALMSEPLFNSLRTQQQTGYVASCGMRCTHKVLGFSVWLMSSKVDPAEICRRVEAFLVEFRQRLVDMSAEDLERHVVSLAAQKLEPERSVSGVQGTAWGEIQERGINFDRYLREAVALATISMQDVLRLLDECLMADGPRRRLLITVSVGGRGPVRHSTGLRGAEGVRAALAENYPGSNFVSSQADFLRSTRLHESFL